MDALPLIITAGVAAFVATNIDDLLLLSVFFAQRTLSRTAIVVGQFTGIGVLFGVSALAAALSFAVPGQYLAWMGLIPIALGAKALLSDSNAADDEPHSLRPNRWQFLAVAGSTIANGGDNIGVYVPLFATNPPRTLIVWSAIFIAMTALWCFTAAALVSRAAVRTTIDRYGHRVLPWVLIAIGLWIVSKAWR